MADQEKQLVVSLTDGVTETVQEEVAGGVIVTSTNTRLTKVKGTLSRRPLISAVTTRNDACGGLFVGGRGSVLACYENGQSQRVLDSLTEQVVAPATGTAGASAYYPYPMVDSGAVGGGFATIAPATCFDSLGNQWFLNTKITTATAAGTFVSVIADGRDVITPRVIHTQAAIQFWVGLTPCTGGVVAWYEDTTGISAVRLTLSGVTLTVGTPVSVYTPVEPSGYIQAAIDSDGANTGYLLCRDSVATNLLNLHKVNLTTLALTATSSIAGAVANTTPPVFMCVTYVRTAGVSYLLVQTSEGAGVTYKSVRLESSLGVVWQLAGAGRYGAVSVLPWFANSTKYAVFAQTLTAVTGVGTDASAVIFDTYDLLAGTIVDTGYVYWYGLQGKGGYHTPPTSLNVYPYFPLFARWGVGGAPPSVPGGTPTIFMDTPSAEVVTPYSPTVYTPVMRFGVDSVSQYSASAFNSTPSAVSSDGRLCLTYMADRYDQPSAANALFNAKYVVFDLRPDSQPSTAVDAGYVSAIGASMPAAWDGVEVTEYAPFHRPKIGVIGSGGSGPALTGTISYSAVVSWKDAWGNVRRSAPALPVTVTLAAAKPQVYVTMPLSMRQGERQEMYDITVYSTVPGGSVLISLNAQGITRGTIGCWKFDFIPYAINGDLELYSQFSGVQPLQPECPPPIWDMRSIGGRYWLIDAENRYRILPSLLKQTGIAVEFNSNLEIVGFDQQYGKLMAIADVSGTPVAFAERGIWQVDGYGPDNAGQGGAFVDPKLISNMGCRSRESVAQVPGVGVMFQANDGHFCLLSGGFKRFETFGVYDVTVPTVHLLQNEIAYPLSDGTGWVVYNWLADGWTHWDDVGTPYGAVATLQTDDRSRTYLAAPGGIWTMDSDSIDTRDTRSMVVTRGWIVPESPQGDCVIREVWFHGIVTGSVNGDGSLVGQAGVTLTASFDYDESNSVSRTWTAAELYALSEGGKYTVALNCSHTKARAVRVTASSVFDGGANEDFHPLSLTVTYGVTAGVRRRTLKAGALK